LSIQKPIIFDALVIGGGHNGLACAAYLARAGQKVIVVEARDIFGGFTTTERPFPQFPNVMMPMAAMDLAVANMPPSIIDELSLCDAGLKLLDLDPFYSYIHSDGTSVVFWRDVEKTCAEIAKLSQADADAYRAFTSDMQAFWFSAAPYLHNHPTRLSLKTLVVLISRALPRTASLIRAARTLSRSPRAVLDATFSSPALRAALSNLAAASSAPMDKPGTGIILAIMAMQHLWGVRRPVGGMGAFVESLITVGRAHGVTYQASAPVKHIVIENDAAVGVELVSGEQIRAKNIIGALDPTTLMTRLLPSAHRSDALRNEIDKMTVFAFNVAAARVDFLLDGLPESVLTADRTRIILPTNMLIGPDTIEESQAYIAACAMGILGDNISIWAACPSLEDNTLTQDSNQQCFYVYIPAVPYQLANGEAWSARREDLGAKVLAKIEKVMPGFSKRILARAVRTPEDISKISGLEKGCQYHVDMSLSQMGPWRPTRSLSGYKTPILSLWHTGAGAHPMAAVNGISGKLAAAEVLRKS
jgi:beta-carotene ketolase (CrtO type)